MTKLKSLLVCLATFLIALPTLVSADCRGDRDPLRELRGNYAYQISGEDGPTGLTNVFVETGRFTADGRGGISATAVSVINGSIVETASYVGTYTVDRHVATVRALRTSDVLAPVNVTFLISIADRTDTVFIQGLPAPGTDLAFANIKGEGRK